MAWGQAYYCSYALDDYQKAYFHFLFQILRHPNRVFQNCQQQRFSRLDKGHSLTIRLFSLQLHCFHSPK